MDLGVEVDMRLRKYAVEQPTTPPPEGVDEQ
jgi:hypothetical protein